MLLLWILCLIIFIILLRYAYLIIKRSFLILKIKRRLKKNGGSLKFCRHMLTSVFKSDGKTDFMISCNGKDINISVITTPFRRVRYHFNNNKSLEVIFERRGLFVANPKSRSSAVVIDHPMTIWKGKIEFVSSDIESYVIVNPAPFSISKSQGSIFSILHNNDVLFENIKICGLKYFLDNVI